MQVTDLLPQNALLFTIQDDEEIHRRGIGTLIEAIEKRNPLKVYFFLLAEEQEVVPLATKVSEIVEAVSLDIGAEVFQILIKLKSTAEIPTPEAELYKHLFSSKEGLAVFAVTRRTRNAIVSDSQPIQAGPNLFFLPKTPAFRALGEEFGLN